MYWSQHLVDFELEERRRSAERVHVQTGMPVLSRLGDAATIGLGHMLVRVGTRLEQIAGREKHVLALSNPDPCRGCAN